MAERLRVRMFELFQPIGENGKTILLEALEHRLHRGAPGLPPLPAREKNQFK